MPKLHTVPNSITVQIVLDTGHHPMHVCIVRRDGVQLAHYPAKWTNNMIPSISEVQKDFRWNETKGDK